MDMQQIIEAYDGLNLRVTKLEDQVFRLEQLNRDLRGDIDNLENQARRR